MVISLALDFGLYFALYVAAILVDGDADNDWLTHLPEWTAGAVHLVGAALSTVLGY